MTDVTLTHDRLEDNFTELPDSVEDTFNEIHERASENGVMLEEMTIYTSDYGWQLGELGPSENDLHEEMSGMPLTFIND